MTASVLDRIEGPADVKSLDLARLTTLAAEVRREIIETTAVNGGHLATNLGTVELSLALHWAFDSPRDRIIWDVGNQCYTHKLITGRRDKFRTIRTTGGLSGFIHRTESPHDHLTAGHAGTAVSSALGIATAREQMGEDYRVVAVVGDGAMTSGMSYEALNNVGVFKSQLLVILNDNGFSISSSSGALARTLSQARSKILDGTIFEELGITYLGPIDGHDLQHVIDVLHEVKQFNRPVVLHVLTHKGKGYPKAEADPQRFHGVSPFDPRTGRSLAKPSAPTYSTIFGEALCRLAESDDRIVALTAAMAAGTGLTLFAERWPERFFDVGIAEQHAVTFAGGMALGGCRPVVAIYSTFLQRGYDQVLHDVCLQDLPVTFVLDRAGFAGSDGPTHHGVFDFGYLRIAPRMVVMAPKDGDEMAGMLAFAVRHPGPAAIRIPRGAVPSPVEGPATDGAIELGRGELLRPGSDVALVAIGSMVCRAVEVAELLKSHGVSAAVINARFVKPLDEDLILETVAGVDHVFTIEEHMALGGFGSAVAELLAERGVCKPVTILGLPDRFIEHGSEEALLDDCGLSPSKIVKRVREEIARHGGSEIGAEADSGPAGIAVDEDASRAAIERIRNITLPEPLTDWIRRYETVGKRDGFLWNWCLEGVRLTRLSCVDDSLRDANDVTKVLGVMFDVLLDDVADASDEADYLEQLIAVATSVHPVDFGSFSLEQRAYAGVASALWETIQSRAGQAPRYAEFRDLLRFDYLQLLNTMRYSMMLNQDVRLLNMAEHDLYLPHNMHMMASGTLDLMCSPEFDRSELGLVRECLWHAQCMGRVGNLVTTWERELKERDFTSGVFARAILQGVLTPEELRSGATDKVRSAILSNDCEGYFLRRWRFHREQIDALGGRIRSVDVGALTGGLERLIAIHLGSRGLK